jgi:hypothetical protein
MTWSYDSETRDPDHRDYELVKLTFKRAPNCDMVLYVPGLLQKLKKMNKPYVTMEFSVERPLWKSKSAMIHPETIDGEPVIPLYLHGGEHGQRGCPPAHEP